MTQGRRHADVLCAAVLALLPLAALGRALLPGKVLSPADILSTYLPFAGLGPSSVANPLLFDVTFMFHPWLIYAGQEMAAGRFPLWDPYAFAGAPFFANPQTALLFPLTALVFLLPAATALTLIAIGNLVIAGLSTYWLGRTLGVRPDAAFVGALVYMFNAALVVWLQWSLGNAMAVLPLVFGATEWLRARRDFRATAVLALAVGLELVAGYPQMAAVGVAVAGLWALYRSRGLATWPSFLGRFALGVALGIGLAMAQMLPFVEYARESSVLFYRAQWIPATHAPLRTAIGFLMPWYYGAPGRDFWGYSNFNETATSVGILPWLLVPVAAVVAWRRNGTPFFLGLVAFTIAALYRLPVAGDALTRVPPFAWMAPERTLLLGALALSVLTATALDALATAAPPARARSRVAVVAAFLALVALALVSIADDAEVFARRAGSPPITLQYAGFLAVLTLSAWLVVRLHETYTYRQIAALALLQLANVLPLVVTYPTVSETRLLYPTTPVIRHLERVENRDHGRVRLANLLNLGALYHLREVAGYDGVTPRWIEEVANPGASLGLWGNGPMLLTTAPWSPVFDLLAIRRVVTAPGAPAPAPHFVLEYDGADARVFRNDRARSRARLVPRARACVEDAHALALMHEGRIDFGEEVLIAGCEAVPGAGPRTEPWRAEIREDAPERIVIEIDAGAAAWLVLSDTWFPGWRATLDGVEQRVWRANHAFRAIWLPAGHHVVTFTYAPASVHVGVVASLMALGAIAGCFAVSGFRRISTVVRQRIRLEPEAHDPRETRVGPNITADSPNVAHDDGDAQERRLTWVARAWRFMLVALLLSLGLAAIREGWLPGGRAPVAPFELHISPTPLVAGERTVLRIEPRRGAPWTEPLDLYVDRVRGTSAASLTPAGDWTTAPATPIAQAVSPSNLPIEVAWLERGPPGWIRLIAVPVRPSLGPRRREHWTAPPVIATVRVRPEPSERLGPLLNLLLPFGGLTLLAIVVVVRRGLHGSFTRSAEPR